MTLPAAELRVMVVDDEPLVRSIVSRYLLRSRFQVVQASSGEEAMSTLAVESVDVILTDANMTGLSGLDLFDQVTTRDPDMPVFIMSGAPCPTHVEGAARRRWLEKPLNLAALGPMLSQAVRSPRAAQS